MVGVIMSPKYLIAGLALVIGTSFSTAQAVDRYNENNDIYQASEGSQGLNKYRYKVPKNSWYMAKIKPKHKGIMRPKNPQPDTERQAIPFWGDETNRQ
jgi:hypothetical protein